MGFEGGRSSVQRFFEPHKDSLSIDDAIRLAEVFFGRGTPPIASEEIMVLAGKRFEVALNNELPPQYMNLPKDVPVYGTAMGTYRTSDGPEIEQAFIDYSETIDHFERPPGYLKRTGIYGFYIVGESMEPRWDSGDPAYADPKRPPQIGDDVVVYLVRPNGQGDEEPEAVLIKRLVRQSGSFLELQQFNPPLTFKVDRRRIKMCHRVIPRKELLTMR